MNKQRLVSTRWLLIVSAIGLLAGLVISTTGFSAEADGMMPMRQMMQRMMPGALPPPDFTSAQLPQPGSRGAQLLSRYCAQCHAVPGPGLHTAGEWPSTLDRMQQRMHMHARMMGGINVPDRTEFAQILGYLKTHAQQPLPRSRHGILKEPGGEPFRRTCAQCHALPDPRQHTATEWPAVAVRMRQHMVATGRTPPDDKSFAQIIEFLGRHARQP